MLKRLTPFAITLWWLAMMATLVYRYVPGGLGRTDGPPLDTAALADVWRDSEEWMDLRWNGVRVGAMRTVARLLPAERSTESSAVDSAPSPKTAPRRPAYQVVILIGLDIGFLKSRLSTSALLNERLILDQFLLRLNIGEPGAPGASELDIDGLARGTSLLVRVQRGDTRQFRSLKLDRPVALAESLAPLYSRSDLKVGDTYTLPVFDPVWKMQGGVMTVHVAGRETLHADNRAIDALRIESTLGSLKTVTWVDDTGKVWKREIPPLDMTAVQPDDALQRFPWMAKLPDPPRLTLADMQGKAYGEPLGTAGLLGVIREAINPQDNTATPNPAQDSSKGQSR